jgi:hypothetical protein
VNSNINLKINIGTSTANKITQKTNGQIASAITLNGKTTTAVVAIKSRIGEPYQDINGSSSRNYYQNLSIPISFDVPVSVKNSLSQLTIHLYSTLNAATTPQAVPFCGDSPLTINSNITINDKNAIDKFLERYNSVPVVLSVDCLSGQVGIASAPTYTRADLNAIINGYLSGTYTPLQTSVALSNYDHRLGLQIKFCDPPTGGCTPQF